MTEARAGTVPTGRRLALPMILLASAVACPLAAQETPVPRSREAQRAIAEQITQCTDDQRQFFASGLRRAQYLLFCNCYVHSALDAIDADELSYRHAHDNAPSPQFVETSRALVTECIQEARRRAPE